MGFLDINNVTKSYGAVEVLHKVDIAVEEGEFLVLVGPSGCGKSTLLNMIAGLEDITSGEIGINGRVVNGVHPSNRNIAMVFQSYALYPNMTVGQNITFGLEMHGVPKPERDKAMNDVAKLLQIEQLLDRKPGQLSGGQRQRVAMGRALVRDPDVFLFDEPLSNLDAKLRVDMRTEIKKLHEKLKTTIVYVTHDQIEAMTLSTRIAVMYEGYVQQLGIKVGQRFIKQEHIRITHKRAPHGDPLTLTSRELARFAIQQLFNLQQLGDICHGLFAFGFCDAVHL